MAKFTTLIPLLLLISCKFSFLIVDFKISSLPTFVLNSNKIFMIFQELIEHMLCFLTKVIILILTYPQLD